MLLAFTVHRRVEENRKGQIDRSTMTRLIILDCVGILLFLVSAMVVGSYVSKVVGTAVFNALQVSAPQWAQAAAIASSLLAALATGVVVGWLARSAWGRVERMVSGKKPEPRPTE
jgi:ABC-type antimicrobial peptide transport system permease subunit